MNEMATSHEMNNDPQAVAAQFKEEEGTPDGVTDTVLRAAQHALDLPWVPTERELKRELEERKLI